MNGAFTTVPCSIPPLALILFWIFVPFTYLLIYLLNFAMDVVCIALYVVANSMTNGVQAGKKVEEERGRQDGRGGRGQILNRSLHWYLREKKNKQ